MSANPHCLLCSSETPERLFELHNSPLVQNKLFGTTEEALAAKRVEATYHYCPRCHFAFNPTFDRSLVDYTSYYNEQIESQTYRTYVDALALRLKDDCGLTSESRILEIGCGSGYFLSRLKAVSGSRHMLGFDPAYKGAYGMHEDVRRRLFDGVEAGATFDLIVLRHCLEGLLDEAPIMELLGNGTPDSARLYIEVNDLDYILGERNPSLLFHEYYRYFSSRAMDIFLRQVGFRLERLNSLFGGCYMGITARRGPTIDLRDAYSSLEKVVRRYRRVVIWGTSGRSISLLSHLSWDRDVVAFGVDIDPAKQGMFMPITGQKILSPDEARAFAPDLVIVANELYAREVRKEFDGDVRFVTLRGQIL